MLEPNLVPSIPNSPAHQCKEIQIMLLIYNVLHHLFEFREHFGSSEQPLKLENTLVLQNSQLR